jgi:hypothetical protein
MRPCPITYPDCRHRYAASGRALIGNSVVEIINPDSVKNRLYIVTFEDTLYRQEVPIACAYTVIDSATGDTVMATNDYWGPSNGDVFDGIRISFNTAYQNLDNIEIDTNHTYWTDTTLMKSVSSLRILSITVLQIFIAHMII